MVAEVNTMLWLHTIVVVLCSLQRGMTPSDSRITHRTWTEPLEPSLPSPSPFSPIALCDSLSHSRSQEEPQPNLNDIWKPQPGLGLCSLCHCRIYVSEKMTERLWCALCVEPASARITIIFLHYLVDQDDGEGDAKAGTCRLPLWAKNTSITKSQCCQTTHLRRKNTQPRLHQVKGSLFPIKGSTTVSNRRCLAICNANQKEVSLCVSNQ